MRNYVLIKFLFLTIGIISFKASAQHLTISTSGEAGTSGTNWSITGNVLNIGNSGTASINTSVISNHLSNTGDLTIDLPWQNGVGRNININNTIAYSGSSARTLTFQSANDIVFANAAGITSSTASLNVSLLSKSHIVNSSATTITTQGGNVLFASNVDDATDGEATTNGYIRLGYGITINTNGGNITFGGGNISGTDYALGSSSEAYTEGIRFDAVIALNSGGGNIALRGKSYAMGVQQNWGAAGVGFFAYSAATGTINSGTGTITIDGYSQTNTSSYAAGFYSQHNLTITSANTTANAINIIGKATGASGEAWGIETESIFSVLATGIGGGITLSSSQQNSGNNLDIAFRGETNILAKSGPINIITGQSGGITNGYLYLAGYMYLGSKAGSAVTNSSSNINIQVDRYYYDNFVVTRLATSGSVSIQPNAASFGANIYTSFFNFNENGQTMTNFTFGKSGNAANVYLDNAITVAGPISVYGNYVGFTGNITSSATGDIFIKSLGNGYPAVNIGSGITINKSAGTGTLTFQANGSVINNGTLSATGTGLLNVVMWSDYDNTNNDGGISQKGTLSTNGGHVWIGGSNTTSGSYTWNGLTVGDGPSIGTTNYNCHSMDIYGPITTAGGDVLLWAGSFAANCGTNGIVSDGSRLINAGSGDITLIAYQTSGAIELTSTGVVSLVPHAGSYASALTLGGILTSGNFTFNTSFYNGLKINSLANVGGLTIGKYEGMLSSGSPLVLGNTSNVSFSTNINIGGPIIVYGGTIALDANLTTTNNGDISLYTDNALGGLTTTARNITAAGSFNYIPRTNFFSAPVTYPITNLNLTSSGLLIGKPSNSADITFANTTTINGPITVYGGTLALNENLSSSAGSTISLYGNILNFANGKTVTSSGLLIVAPQNTAGSIGMGGANGTLQLPASYFSTNFTDGFSLIQIGSNNHSSAIVSNAFNLRDHMALYTTGSVTLGGKPVLGVNNLTLGSAISSISSGATNYFKTNGTGKVFRNIPNGSNLIFPIGRAIYNPVTITNNTGASDNFSVLVLDSVFLNGTTGPLITTPHVKTTWDISKTNPNGGSGVDFLFGWILSQEVGTFTSYKLNHHSSTWAFAAGTSQTPSGTTIKGMSHTGYSGTFSPFAISEGAYALPVELISFNASCISNETKLEWQTASEHNTIHFVVERSLDGMVWEKLGEFAAAGNSTSILNYSFIDTALVARALTYYRLVQIDIDGKSETFGPVSSDCAIESTSIGLQPNPCVTEVTLSIASQIPTEVNYTLISPEGKVLENKQMAVQSGITLFTLDVSNYPSGMYMLQLDVNDKHFIKKLTVQ